MSGGSFNYISSWAGDGEMLMEKRYDLGCMAEFLNDTFPGTEAAKDTDELHRLVNHFEAELSRRSKYLSEVWHDVEWWQSCDKSLEAAEAAIEQYAVDKAGARQ